MTRDASRNPRVQAPSRPILTEGSRYAPLVPRGATRPTGGSTFLAECTPGYYNNEGKAEKGHGLYGNVYGPGSIECFALLNAWRKRGDLEGMELR